jgi:voltage-gated potassium channel
MPPGRRFRLALGLFAVIIAVGTGGFVAIEGVRPLDALYLTITTITTVGYGDIVPHTTAGRIFTIGLILLGVGTALYFAATVAELLIEGRLQEALGRRRSMKMEHLTGHVIVCGFGRLGRVVAEALVRTRTDVVVIESDPLCESDLDALGVPYVIGSATMDDVLERAGIRRARALVAATGSDPDNVFITLAAREKNPSLRIHARGETDAGLRRLRLAGADQTVSAYQMGGLRMANAILRPAVVDFLDITTPGRGEEIDLEEILVDDGSRLDGRTVEAVESEVGRLRIVALKRGNEAMRLIPDPRATIAGGDFLVAIGDRDSLEGLARLAQTRG